MARTFAWDASDYDWARGSMDLPAALHDGVQVFWHKATEGSTWRAKNAGQALGRAKSAGFQVIGAYHVVRSSSSAAAQVSNLLSYADANFGWWRNFDGWFWVADVEHWSNDQVSAATGLAFAEELRRRQPKPVVIYASKGQYGTSFVGKGFPLWNANYGSNPATHYPNAVPADTSSRWAGWEAALQYGSRLTVGSQESCDVSVHKGDLASFQAAIGMAIKEELMDLWGDQRAAAVKNIAWRSDGVLYGELWTNEMLERNVYDDAGQPGSIRTQRIRRTDEGVQQLLARPPAEFTEEHLDALAAALAPRLVAPLVAAMRQELSGVTFRADVQQG